MTPLAPHRPARRCRRAVPAASLVLVLALAACSGAPREEAEAPSPSTTTSFAAGSAPSSAPSATGTADALPAAPHELSLPTLMREEMVGGPLQRVRETAAEGPYQRFEVTYDSSGTTVSGVLLVPEGPGPFPAVVLAHGYIEPSAYVTGQGMRREQDRLARAGYVVLHTDYRGHAASSPAGDLDRESRLGYTRDVVNAVRSLERETVVDADRTAVVGRSMGGAVAYNVLVTQPGLVDAAVVFAPVSSDFVDNYERWAVPERADVVERLTAGVGTPEENPAFYAGLSARTYADRISEPVLIHHGTADDTCPLVWSQETQAAFTAAGVDSTLLTYPGEGHAFGPQFEVSMERTIAFLGEHLTGG
ncbi:alpha/beta hydrolase family protein [Nocardioides sp. CPCC 205120]|uniref:alpha/beta hydrolase family protein n=1 Tax=Nocardioides sp. CPCC 205120 TaxID=3406462 RepID=UPI003B50457D